MTSSKQLKASRNTPGVGVAVVDVDGAGGSTEAVAAHARESVAAVDAGRAVHTRTRRATVALRCNGDERQTTFYCGISVLQCIAARTLGGIIVQWMQLLKQQSQFQFSWSS